MTLAKWQVERVEVEEMHSVTDDRTLAAIYLVVGVDQPAGRFPCPRALKARGRRDAIQPGRRRSSC
jgi:hypothetical protein